MCTFSFYLFPIVLVGTAAIITRILYKLRYLSEAEEDLDGDASDLIVFSYLTIKVATNNFSKDNKLGEGGFGTVYKVKFGNSSLASQNCSRCIIFGT